MKAQRWIRSAAVGLLALAGQAIGGDNGNGNGQRPATLPSTAPVAVPAAPPIVVDAVQAMRGDQPCADWCAPSKDPVHYLVPGCGRNKLYGWFDGGYIFNASDPVSGFNGPYNAVDFTEGQFNQAYVVAERKLADCGWSLGGRVDLIYGSDFLLAQSVGFELYQDGGLKWNNQFYGLAIPQAYAEVGNTNVSLKVGHFYTIVGYEGVPSINNFFYSHAYSYQFAGPFTHWGALGSVRLNEHIVAQAGVVNGWNKLDGLEDKVNFLGSIRYVGDCERWSLGVAVITGDENNLVNDEYANRTRYSVIATVKPTCKTEYVFHQWFGLQEDGQFLFGNGTALWYGIDQYLFYKINDCWKLGARFEWFRDEDGTRVGLNRPANPNKRPLPGNYYSITGGVNYLPHPNVIIRPEVRYDFSDDTIRNAYDDGLRSNQFMVGLDMILRW